MDGELPNDVKSDAVVVKEVDPKPLPRANRSDKEAGKIRPSTTPLRGVPPVHDSNITSSFFCSSMAANF